MVRNQKIKFIRNLFTRGFCKPEEIQSIEIDDKRDYLIILFSLRVLNQRISKFFKVYKK